MRKLAKIIGIILGVLVVLLIGVLVYVNAKAIPTYPTGQLDLPTQLDSLTLLRGRSIVQTNCGYCHQAEDGTFSGKLFDCTGQLGATYTANLTSHATLGLGRYSDGELAYLLRTAIKKDGTYAGPWMNFPHLSNEDIAAVITYLRSDAPELAPVAVARTQDYPFILQALMKMKVLAPYTATAQESLSTPPASDQLVFGRYLATAAYECYGCHSPSFEQLDIAKPENTTGFFSGGNPLTDFDCQPIASANLTPHPVDGIGNWSLEDVTRAVRSGISPDGQAVSTAMPRYAFITDMEIAAIYAYLQTIPAIETTK